MDVLPIFFKIFGSERSEKVKFGQKLVKISEISLESEYSDFLDFVGSCNPLDYY